MANPHIDGLWLCVVLLQRIYQAHKYPVELGRIFFDYKRVMLIYNQPVDKFNSYNAATHRQAPLPCDSPTAVFPEFPAFYPPTLPTE